MDSIVLIDASFQVIKANIFEEISVLVSSMPQWNVTIQNLMGCYNILGKPKDGDLHDIHMPEYEGSWAL